MSIPSRRAREARRGKKSAPKKAPAPAVAPSTVNVDQPIANILAEIGDDSGLAAQAIADETAGKARVSLLDALEAIANG